MQKAGKHWSSLCASAQRCAGPVGPVVAGLLRRVTIDSPVVLAFSAACVAVFLANNLVAGTAVGLFACPAWAQFSLFQPLSYLRLFTHVLGHADQNHLRGNLTNLLLVGPPCERQFGSQALLAIIAHVAFWSALTHVALGGSTSWQLGKPGCILLPAHHRWLLTPCTPLPASPITACCSTVFSWRSELR